MYWDYEKVGEMMRPIKYRAWLIPKGKMYPVEALNFHPENGEVTYVFITEHAYGIPVKDVILREFTGLKDRQGKEIYEGDILRIEDATAQVIFWERPPEFGLNFHHNEDKWCEDWNLSDDSERMEIVGNIYENAELLK